MDDHFVIFFDKFEDDIFNPKAIIFSDDLLVESENAKITYNDNKINLIYNGSEFLLKKRKEYNKFFEI